VNELLTGVVIAALISGVVSIVGWLIKRPLDRAAIEQTSTATATSLIAPLRSELAITRTDLSNLRNVVRRHLPGCSNPDELREYLDAFD
jgi:hypothetical protein